LQPVDIKSWWRHNWKSAQVVNSHLVCDPTIRQPGFDLPRQQTVVSAEPFSHGQGDCGACRRKWQLTDTDLCPCGKTQTISHIVESCPLTKLNGSLSRLHSADEDAVSWLTSYGSWNAYENKKKWILRIEFCNYLLIGTPLIVVNFRMYSSCLWCLICVGTDYPENICIHHLKL